MNIHKQTRFISNLLASICLFLLLSVTTQVKMQHDEILEAPAVTGPLYRFTSHLLTSLNDGSKNESENIIVSPISIHKALNMVLLGTDQNSTTKRELLDTIGYSGLSDAEVQKCHEDYAKVLARFKHMTMKAMADMKQERQEDEDEDDFRSRMRYGTGSIKPIMDMFNMVITHNKAAVLPEYKAAVTKYYESTVENVDDKKPETKTAIAERLNKWGKEAGFDQPIMTIEELGGEYEAILLSAIRVQASWMDEFYEKKGETMFYNHGLKDKPVTGTKLTLSDVKHATYLELTDAAHSQFKHRNEKLSNDSDAFGQLSYLNAQIVNVPLDGGLTYTIFEPVEHSTPGDNKLQKLVNQLFDKSENGAHGSKLSQVLNLLESQHAYVYQMHLTMPKFKFEQELSLVRVLQTMGLRRAFDRMNAEISNMTSNKLCISDAKHQAMIDVNKNGIKAAGVTKIKMMLLSAVINSQEPLRVTVNKPFVFMIRYNKIPLFVGQVSSL